MLRCTGAGHGAPGRATYPAGRRPRSLAGPGLSTTCLLSLVGTERHRRLSFSPSPLSRTEIGDLGESGEPGWRVRRTRPESPPAVALRPGSTVDAGSSFGKQGTRRLLPALPLPLSPPLGPAAQSWTRESGGGRQTENPGRKLLAFSVASRGARRPHPTPVCFSGSSTGGLGLQCSSSLYELDEDEDGK